MVNGINVPEPRGSNRKPTPDPNVVRQPPGNRTGGRFAPKVTSEPIVRLEGAAVSDEYSRQEERIEAHQRDVEEKIVLADMERSLIESSGFDTPEWTPPEPIRLGGSVEGDDTWKFPPTPTSDIERLARFFATLKLPDHSVQNFENADRYGRNLEIWESDYREWKKSATIISRRWKKTHTEAEADAVRAEWRAREAVVERVRNQWGVIPRESLRDVMRVGAYWYQVQRLSDADIRRAARIDFVTSAGEIMYGPRTTLDFKLFQIEGAFFDRVKY